MTTAATDEQPLRAAQPGEVVAADLPCPCGYNLRGLPTGGRCPECGGDVADAIRWQQHGFGDPAALRRMTRGLAIVLAATMAWAIVLPCRGYYEGGDRAGYILVGLSGLKTLIVPQAFVTPRSPLLLNFAVPACYVLHLVGLWLFTSAHRSGRAAALRWGRLVLRWCALLAFAGAMGGYLLWDHNMHLLIAASVGDAVVGALCGMYFANLAAMLNATRLRLGGWIVAIGSLVTGGAFAATFLLMAPNSRYWETMIWASLTAWTGVGILCTTLLALLWQRLRRELRATAANNSVAPE